MQRKLLGLLGQCKVQQSPAHKSVLSINDFLYKVDQLEPWVDRIRKISGETRDTYVVTNNHNLGKATVNAFELQALFGKRINPPAQLVQAYPELEQLALNSGSG